MKDILKKADVGIVIGRFQVNELHQAHVDLIQTVCDRHDRVLIFLGLSPLRNTLNNPLDFKPRKAMIEEKFPKVEVFYQDDCMLDEVWSKKLDDQIQKWLQPNQKVLLYGSRDSFLKHYTGKFEAVELESTTYVSGTEIRKKIINQSVATKDFRAGMIYATGTRYPTSFQTVDIIVEHDVEPQILLARKDGEDKYRVIGGFVDPKDESLERAAVREFHEEIKNLNVDVTDFRYAGSARIDDWRYRYEQDKIMTALYVTKRIYGAPQPADDIVEAKWFKIGELYPENYKYVVVPQHHVLLEMYRNFINK